MEAIPRHRTAMRRRDVSRPVRTALDQGILRTGQTVFDFGCGHGGDVEYLVDRGFTCDGWDPQHRPDGQPVPADVVNLGFVVNVIESPTERAEVLRQAWELARNVLVVSARLTHEERLTVRRTLNDGVLTSRGTFQKFYEQGELQAWVTGVLREPAVPAAPGVFYVFRNPVERNEFEASRFRRRSATPRLRQSDQLYAEHEDLFAPLLEFMGNRGRLPAMDELPNAEEVCDQVGSIRRAATVLSRVFGDEPWSAAAEASRTDLAVYLALAAFGGRPRMGELPLGTQRDIKAFFGSHRSACKEADRLLFAAGRLEEIAAAAQASEVGKVTPSAIYVHAEYVGRLAPLLRTYEGCARVLVGDVPGANIIKLSLLKPQISYLSYPTFDTDPHPELDHSVVVKLQSLAVQYRFFRRENPPVLHRKDAFLATDDRRHEKFARLTRQEERWGLLDDGSSIGTRDGWNAALKARDARLVGHRICRSLDWRDPAAE